MSGKQFWGPAMWRTIHSLAIAYTPSQADQFRKFIGTLPALLPCEQCRIHLKQNLKILKVDDYLTSNHNLFLWSYLLHDMVNKQLGTISPPYESTKLFYIKSMGPECKACKLNM